MVTWYAYEKDSDYPELLVFDCVVAQVLKYLVEGGGEGRGERQSERKGGGKGSDAMCSRERQRGKREGEGWDAVRACVRGHFL